MNQKYTQYLVKTGTFIKINKKPILWVGGSVIAVIVTITLVKRLQKGIGNVFTDKSVKENPFVVIDYDKSKATISDAIANSYANQLYNAMKNYGTDNDAIYQILQKLQKKEDFLKVYNAFGTKSYVGVIVGGSPGTVASYLGMYDNFDLIEWFRNEVGYKNYPTYSLIKKTVTNAGLAF